MPRGWVPTAIVFTTDGGDAARSMTDTFPVEWFAVHRVRPSRLIASENGSAATSIGVPSVAGEVPTSIGTTLPQPEAYTVRPSGLTAMPNAPIVPSEIGALATGGDTLRSIGCTTLPELAPQSPKLAMYAVPASGVITMSNGFGTLTGLLPVSGDAPRSIR